MANEDSEDRADLSAYFADETSMILFTLIYLDGSIRERLLGIDEGLYESRARAKGWRGRLLKKIHPDRCRHPEAARATANLDKIYRRMIKHAG